MKKLIIFCVVIGLLSITNYADANPSYTETVDVYTYSVGGNIDWQHNYDGSVDPLVYIGTWGTEIGSATLTIVADDVDPMDPENPGYGSENDEVYITVKGTEYYLGELTQMSTYTNWAYYPGQGNPPHPESITTTVFDLGSYFDLSLLEGGATLDLEARIETSWGAEVETSTLTIVSAIPAPGAILLGSIGVGLVGWLRRRRTL